MKVVLFCYHPYAFGILMPLNDALVEQQHSIVWYVREVIAEHFKLKDEVEWTSSIAEINRFSPDVIYVPGNEVPHYLRGVKVQIFHGLAGEKKGHFRIRDYFDLYLTQGPYFTRRFKELALKHGDFDVEETGWCKLDSLFNKKDVYTDYKENLIKTYEVKNILLYAPTFSPSLTSVPSLLKQWEKFLDKNTNCLLFIKFHDLMDPRWKQKYKSVLEPYPNVVFVDEPDIIKYLVVSDLMISDTSSVVYEFLLLNKPVITFKSTSENICWDNFEETEKLSEKITESLTEDPFGSQRKRVIEEYHPYNDGKSSFRMIDAVKTYISMNGVPERRKLNLYRRFKIRKLFGPKPE
ncbi:CDP-glycerol--poly(glycerophosphate) glycerophosphotransferase [Marinilabilia salmonicolor]|uniref:CDP-glycerol--poly(glycerophosphate) glycerophosphotransferase n=1 Tax=Marinilabilia salmonicolor TaxID=989 RepID=UPI000299E776|nr:CDP-glycerol--poly(glycerophosphate) glycerophosphotransferase [Marinilabilia salmonicolor]